MLKPSEDLKDILGSLTEECAEAIQAVSKINRFGLDGKGPGKEGNNREELIQELGDVMAVILILVSKYKGEFPPIPIGDGVKKKITKMKKYYKHLKDYDLDKEFTGIM